MAVFRRSQSRSGKPDRLDRDPDDNPYTKPGFIASAFLLLMVLIGVIAVVLGRDDHPRAPTSSAAGGAQVVAPGDSSSDPGAAGTGTGARPGDTGSSAPGGGTL